MFVKRKSGFVVLGLGSERNSERSRKQREEADVSRQTDCSVSTWLPAAFILHHQLRLLKPRVIVRMMMMMMVQIANKQASEPGCSLTSLKCFNRRIPRKAAPEWTTDGGCEKLWLQQNILAAEASFFFWLTCRWWTAKTFSHTSEPRIFTSLVFTLVLCGRKAHQFETWNMSCGRVTAAHRRAGANADSAFSSSSMFFSFLHKQLRLTWCCFSCLRIRMFSSVSHQPL